MRTVNWTALKMWIKKYTCITGSKIMKKRHFIIFLYTDCYTTCSRFSFDTASNFNPNNIEHYFHCLVFFYICNIILRNSIKIFLIHTYNIYYHISNQNRHFFFLIEIIVIKHIRHIQFKNIISIHAYMKFTEF